MIVETSGIASLYLEPGHIKLGGGWRRMVQACRLKEDVMVKFGFPHAGMNDIIYIQVKRPAVVRD